MSNNVPLVKPFFPPRETLIPAIEEVIYSGYVAEGEYVYKFEKKLAELLSLKYALAVSSGTAALHLALKLVGIKDGDEVISTALTAEPTNTSIAMLGANVVFADIDFKTGLISPESIESRITRKTKAIMIVHYAGNVCDLDKINEISIKYNIPVIEDAAHAFMSKYKGKYIGSNSRFTIFSFQAIKHLTTIDGGLLCLTNQDDYERAKRLRWFGLSKTLPRLENNIIEAGFKYNMNNVTAIIGLIQLNYLDQNVKIYIQNGKYFDQELSKLPNVKILKYSNNTEPSYWLYTILVDERDKFIKKMAYNGITCSPLHLRNDFHKVFKNNNELPFLDLFYEKFVHIPCGWWVNNEIRTKIVEIIKEGW
ncbi:MAG TPA: DegT/DnrJ/EryC1/StrS family aminotransferase [Acholeplasmataceae bacterium]|nr:DegT/DnrJ/EryC1/StrS family aminotransferase [Acholeplasmataceae bacterium]